MNWIKSLFHICEFNKAWWHTMKPAVLCGHWKYSMIVSCKCGKSITVLDYEDNLVNTYKKE